MTPLAILRRPPPLPAVLAIAAALALCLAAGALLVAQVTGERGIAPVAPSTDIEVEGVRVDVRGESARDAREEGWREAQRKAWERLDGPAISDDRLQSLVSAIVVERERIGPRRYVATLGVVFDRGRAENLLGGEGEVARSAPLLLIPVTVAGGTYVTYERRNAWQRAWAEYQIGGSRIDYVRPSGAGGESLLVNAGQTGRRSRIWWRNVLDQFAASDVLMAFARLQYQFPGGPIEGTFTARYGPDNAYLDSFTMTAAGEEELPDMLERAVRRFDAIYTRALDAGRLAPDPTLDLGEVEIDPAVQRLIERGRAERAREAAAERAAEARRRQEQERERAAAEASAVQAQPDPTPTLEIIQSHVVQFATPDAATFDATLAAIRAVPGVRGVATRSLAVGGTSVLDVRYAGDLGALAGALRGRGFAVRQGAGALSVSR